MENLPVSVIIVAKNAERTIEECLDSVQRNNPDEIIVVDGNSSDRTVEIARRYTERIYSDVGRGLGYARQLGAEEATQKYISYVDSDVVLEEGSLATMLAELQGSEYIGVNAQLSPKVKCASYWDWAQEQHELYERIRQPDTLWTMACLFRRETVLEYGFDTSEESRGSAGMDDSDLFIRLRSDGHKSGTCSAPFYHHYRADLKSFVEHHFSTGRVLTRYIRKWGPWKLGFWRPPILLLYWPAYCLIKGNLRLIPYFIVRANVEAAGMVSGFFELIGGSKTRKLFL